MRNIFRVPVDNQHFKDTIETGKPLAEIEKFLDPTIRTSISRMAKNGVVRYWGSIPGESNKRNFARLKEGDELLCYRRGKYIALAKAAFMTINRNLAKYSWGETEIGTTWELIYFFSDVMFFDISSKIINEVFSFNDGPVMGFNALSEERVKKFVEKYQSVENLIKNYRFYKSAQKGINEVDPKYDIRSPYEAQFYLVQLGNELEYNTYVPPGDAGRQVFNKKLGESTTVKKDELNQYVGSVILEPMSNIDVIWFKDSYRPKYFFEVIHKTGWSEALLRLDLVGGHFENAKTKIIGPEKNEIEFKNTLRRWSGPRKTLEYRDYDQLIHVYSEALHYKKLVQEFLN